jgi:hypothetical protein
VLTGTLKELGQNLPGPQSAGQSEWDALSGQPLLESTPPDLAGGPPR